MDRLLLDQALVELGRIENTMDVMDSHCAVQRNPNLNSMTENRFETSAKGEISRLEIYERYKAMMDAANN